MGTRHRDSPGGRPAAEYLRAKTQVPPQRAGLLERERLLEPLMTTDDTAVVVVRAPAGSGKTTVLAHWAHADRARDFAWLSLDETDDDIVTFWRDTINALSTIAPEATARATKAISRMSPDLKGTVFPTLVDGIAALERPIVLVLDDYHVITDPDCHDSLHQFVQHLAGPLTLVISSRAEPPFTLAKLAVRGRAQALSQDDLDFTASEVVQLLARHGIRPTDDASSELLALTDGWATGVHLSIGRSAATGSELRPAPRSDLIRDFLVQEVLDPMDPADRDFLRRCSILDTLTPHLCERLTGQSDAAQRLAALGSGNVLITSLDQTGHTFRLHELLRLVLRAELSAEEPDIVDRLHELAAEWLIEHDRPIEAIEHALQASARDVAARTIAGCWFDTLMAGQLTTVMRWLDQFDDAGLRSYPFVLIAAAWTAGFRGDWRAAWRYSEASTRLDAPGETPDGTASFESARALMLAGLGLSGVAEARVHAEIAYRLEAAESRWRPLAAALLGATGLALGRNDEARLALSEAATSMSGPHGVATYAMGQLSILEASEHHWAEAERIASEAIEEIERLGAEHLVSSGGAYAVHAAAAAQRGDHVVAQRRLQKLNPLLPSLSTAMPFDAFQIHLLIAETSAIIGKPRAVAVHVEAAQQLLELLGDVGVLEDRLAALIETADPVTAEAMTPHATPTLTDRERDILALLPSTLSLQEIGNELFVSRDTVKTYVTRIYRKLGVSSRSAAVTRAAQLQLISSATTDRT